MIRAKKFQELFKKELNTEIGIGKQLYTLKVC